MNGEDSFITKVVVFKELNLSWSICKVKFGTPVFTENQSPYIL